MIMMFALYSAVAFEPPKPETADETLAAVKAVHGGAGPWAVLGYRMGARAIKELDLPRQSHQLNVVHRCPKLVQYSCIADGLQAATGASAGKLNLKVEEVTLAELTSIVENRKTGTRLTFTVSDNFRKAFTNLPYEQLEEAGRRVAKMSDDELFAFSKSTTDKK